MQRLSEFAIRLIWQCFGFALFGGAGVGATVGIGASGLLTAAVLLALLVALTILVLRLADETCRKAIRTKRNGEVLAKMRAYITIAACLPLVGLALWDSMHERKRIMCSHLGLEC